ncbi:glycosyltransferase family 32 protein [Teichococcus aestuarii]|uniref:glycosyltransferase family 32 protein n=1 Tax=Teichococcus aestuarii TaxID=568898 RepID=UPI00361ECC48
MIPKRIHYVWVGGPMPDRYRVLVDHWRHLHPDWELVHWSERNIDFSHAPLREAYRRRQWARVSDIARLLAVHRHGGIYLDTDFKVLKPLDPLLDNQCFLSFQDSPSPATCSPTGASAPCRATGSSARRWRPRCACAACPSASTGRRAPARSSSPG